MRARRALLATALVSLYFAIGATSAIASEPASTTLYETITAQEAIDLSLVIPETTTAGYKSLEVQVTGASTPDTFKSILFCKSLDGTVHWDNICPDLANVSAQTALESARTRSSLPTYTPLSDPKNSTGRAIIAFAVLTLVMGAGALASSKISTTSSAGANQPGYMAQLSRGGVLVAGTQLGRGDRAEIWRRPTSKKIDGFFTRTGKQISGVSPLATRILSDGNYLRSLFGPFALVIYPISIALGWVATRSLHQEALPPSLVFILLMMTIGVIDSFAGLLTAAAFIISVIATGHLTSLNAGLTVMGVSLLAFSPTLLAGAFRPFRRAVWDFTSLWERATDYLLASVLTGWVVQQIVLGLPGLAGLRLPLTIHAREIALWAVGLVILRFAAEDLSLKFFPQRLSDLEPEYRARTISQQVFATIFKVAIFGVIAGKFVGFSPELFIGIALFALPLGMGIFEDKFPKSAAIQKWMPTGIIEMLVMTLAGFLLAAAVQHRYPSARNYVLISFVVLSIPGFILKILALFGEDGAEDWKITKFGQKAYRVLGVLALGVLIWIILSGLLVSNNV